MVDFVSFKSYSIKKMFIFGKITKVQDKNILLIPYQYRKFTYAEKEEEEIQRIADGCFLFSQFCKAYSREELDKAFIIIDFEKADRSVFISLAKIAAIGFENEDKTVSYYFDYLKSSSMAAKKKQIFYVLEKYKDGIEVRTTFNLLEKLKLYREKKVVNAKSFTINIPKWYSATGLLLSGCTILDNIKFTGEEICVVPDENKFIFCNSIVTAISCKSLLQDINDVIKLLEDLKDGKINKYKRNELKYRLTNLIRLSESSSIKRITDSKIKEAIDCIKNIQLDNDAEDPHRKDISDKSSPSVKDNLDKAKAKLGNDTDTDVVDWFQVEIANCFVYANLYDGEGLLSKECAETINNVIQVLAKDLKFHLQTDNNNNICISLVKKSGSFQFRLPFCKGVLHSADIKSFFNDKGITTIKGLSYKKEGELIDYDVEKIKIILTESQVKFLNCEILCALFPNSDAPIIDYFNMLCDYEYGLGIVNIDPENDGYVKMNHQFWSTLPISRSDPSYEGLKKSVYKYTEDELTSSTSKEDIKKILDDSVNYGLNLTDKKYFDSNPEFYMASPLLKHMLEMRATKIIKNATLGKVNIEGQRLFLASDLLFLLYKAAGIKIDKNKKEVILNPNEFYVAELDILNKDSSKYHKINKSLNYIILRSPHYSRNEIAILKNKVTEDGNERAKYFPDLKGVIFINAKSLCAQRLSGGDYDGDEVVLITSSEVCKSVCSDLIERKYPTVIIPSLKKKPVEYTMQNKVSSWEVGFNSKVGIISNIAFEQAMEKYNNSEKKDSVIDNTIAFYTIVAGLDIDSKKTGLKPAKYHLNIPKNEFAKAFDRHKKVDPTKIIDVFKENKKDKKSDKASKTDNILVDFVKDYTNKKVNISPTSENILKYHDWLSGINSSKCKEKISKALKKLYIHMAFPKCKSLVTEPYKIINHIQNLLDRKANQYKIPSQDLIGLFSFDSPKKALEIYRSKGNTPFHYLVSDVDKISYLKKFTFKDSKFNQYIQSLDSGTVASSNEQYQNALKCVFDFKDYGYRILYYLIQYQSFKELIDSNHFTNSISDNQLSELTQGVIKKFKNICSVCKPSFQENGVLELVRDWNKDLIKALANFNTCYKNGENFNITEYLDRDLQYKDVTIEDLAAFTDFTSNDNTTLTVYYLFADQIIKSASKYKLRMK